MEKLLIVNADDFGLTRGVNRGILEAASAGTVSSMSAMVFSQEQCDREFRRWPRLRLGVHLRLTGGKPVLPAAEVPTLVDEDGNFPIGQQGVEARTLQEHEVFLEWRAQIESLRGAGISPTHFDSHHHVHSLPKLQRLYLEACAYYNVAGVALSGRQRDQLRTHGVCCPDYSEVRWTDGQLGTLLALLADDFSRHRFVKLMVHPGYNDRDLQAVSGMTDVRERELEVLKGQRLRDWLKRQNITIGGWEDLPRAEDALGQVDVLFLAWNRKEFTRQALAALERNTNWKRVRRLFLYDDGSEDGTLELLRAWRAENINLVQSFLCQTEFRSPVEIMNHYLCSCWPAPWFAKIDSDTVVPPGWLNTCIDVLHWNPRIDFLGIEAKHPLPAPNWDETLPPGSKLKRTAEETDHIGGIGLMRSSAFEELPRANGRMGFSQWQIDHPVNKAWLNPSLPVILLDRLPTQPWAGLSEEYMRRGWQRPWQGYTEADKALWEWWRPV